MSKYYRYIYVAFTKGSGALAALLLTYTVTYFLSSSQAGYFFLGFTVLTIFSVFFRIGLDNVILREFAKSGVSDLSIEKLFRGIVWCFSMMLPALTFIFLFRGEIAEIVFSKPEMSDVILWVVLATPAIVTIMLSSFAFHGLQMYARATLFQGAGYSLLFCLFVILSNFLFGGHLNAATSMKLVAASVICLLVILVICCFSVLKFNYLNFKYFDSSLWNSSSNLWMASLMTLGVTWSSIIFVGIYSPSEDVAFLSTAQRVAQLISFILLVVNAVSAPMFARLWDKRDLKLLEQLAKKSSKIMTLVALPMLLLFIVFSDEIMGSFGNNFERAGILLIIIAVGQFINVSTGCVGYLLSMSGHDRDFRKIAFVSGPLAISLSLLLTFRFGVIGAAFATAIGLSFHNILAVFMVKKRLGFWPVG